MTESFARVRRTQWVCWSAAIATLLLSAQASGGETISIRLDQARISRLPGIGDVFGRRQLRAVETDESRGDFLRGALREKNFGQEQVIGLACFHLQQRLQQTYIVELADFLGGRRTRPHRLNAHRCQLLFGAAAA